MFRTILSGLFEHKARFLLTALAVTIGVAFMMGTFVFTDTIRNSFENLLIESNEGIDIQIRSESGFQDVGTSTLETRAPIPEDVLDDVRSVDGVASAEGQVGGFAQFVDKDGEAIAPMGPPTLGEGWLEDRQLSGYVIRDGRPPEASDEVMMDAGTAEEYGFEVGDTVEIVIDGPGRQFRIVGISGFGEVDNLLGATVAIFEQETAQDLLDREGVYDGIAVATDGDVDAVLERLRAVLPEGVEAVTGEQATEEVQAGIAESLGFFNSFMTALAGVAVLVGAFIIFNIFSIIVAQRTREIGLLRAIGARRRQVVVWVLAEALAMALVAAALGVLLGIVIAIGLKGLFAGLGFEVPSTDLIVEPGAVVVSAGIGMFVTLVAALSPALRASRVSPVTAMRGEEPTRGGGLRRRTVVGLVVTGAGALFLTVGLSVGGDAGPANVGFGAILVFVGVAILTPIIAAPLARLVGAPFARLGASPGQLGRSNAMRNPRRTAATAAGLMVGIAVVAFVGIFAESAKLSTARALDEAIEADLLVHMENYAGFPRDLTERIRAVEEVETAAGFQGNTEGGAQWELDGEPKTLFGADVEELEQVVNLGIVEGSTEDVADGGLLVYVDEAEKNGWEVGDVVEMDFATGSREVEVAGIHSEDGGGFIGRYLIPESMYREVYPGDQDFFVYVDLGDGVSPGDGRKALAPVLAEFPGAIAQSTDEFLADQEESLDQLLSLVNLLLLFAVVIALIGVAITLGLSVVERTREIGLLRAVGMTQRQTRAMVRWESVIVSIIGALLGIALGIVLGWAITGSLESSGITEFGVPWNILVAMVVTAGIAGVVAALYPARRAARMNVLEAVTVE